MPDVFTKAKRSEVMARIRGSGNRSTELRMVRLLRTHGINGWRRGSRLPGRPDFIFQKERVALFVDGCFWHGCPRHGSKPGSNISFWNAKIARNRKRDREVSHALKAHGWKVLRVWEHSLRKSCEKGLGLRLKQAIKPRRAGPRPQP